jgi:hypothetical protein
MENQLAIIQAKVKAPKGQFNSFGKYHYRSAEDILEAVKQVVNPLGYSITISDTIINVGDRYYIKATATLSNGKETWSTDGYAREEESKKGMDGSQVTGASSSYARKYALNGLFALDDTKDSDATNTQGKELAKPIKKEEVKLELVEFQELQLVINSANTIEELNSLWLDLEDYYKNIQTVKDLFSKRKQQLLK